MSILTEKLLFFINRITPNRHQKLLEAKLSPEAYNSFFASRASSSFAEFGDINFKNQHVLDVGCGLGANINFLAQAGAKHITALDISESQIRSTKKMYDAGPEKIKNKITFVAADAARLPFANDSFHSMVAADTFEHINNLAGALQELARVLKSGGTLFAYFPPFYAPWGAHMVNWITVPWCQVFFSEKTILNVARRLEKEKTAVNAHLPAETKLDLGEGDVIPFVNHLTIKRFFDTVHAIPYWHIEMSKLLAPNWRQGNRSIIKLLGWINHLPLVREMFTAKAVFVLRKQ